MFCKTMDIVHIQVRQGKPSPGCLPLCTYFLLIISIQVRRARRGKNVEKTQVNIFQNILFFYCSCKLVKESLYLGCSKYIQNLKHSLISMSVVGNLTGPKTCVGKLPGLCVGTLQVPQKTRICRKIAYASFEVVQLGCSLTHNFSLGWDPSQMVITNLSPQLVWSSLFPHKNFFLGGRSGTL